MKWNEINWTPRQKKTNIITDHCAVLEKMKFSSSGLYRDFSVFLTSSPLKLLWAQFVDFFQILMCLENQMKSQIVPLDFSNRINIYVEHSRTVKYYSFTQEQISLLIFFEDLQKIIFHKVMNDSDITYYFCVLWAQGTHK